MIEILPLPANRVTFFIALAFLVSFVVCRLLCPFARRLSRAPGRKQVGELAKWVASCGFYQP